MILCSIIDESSRYCNNTRIFFQKIHIDMEEQTHDTSNNYHSLSLYLYSESFINISTMNNWIIYFPYFPPKQKRTHQIIFSKFYKLSDLIQFVPATFLDLQLFGIWKQIIFKHFLPLLWKPNFVCFKLKNPNFVRFKLKNPNFIRISSFASFVWRELIVCFTSPSSGISSVSHRSSHLLRPTHLQSSTFIRFTSILFATSIVYCTSISNLQIRLAHLNLQSYFDGFLFFKKIVLFFPFSFSNLSEQG